MEDTDSSSPKESSHLLGSQLPAAGVPADTGRVDPLSVPDQTRILTFGSRLSHPRP